MESRRALVKVSLPLSFVFVFAADLSKSCDGDSYNAVGGMFGPGTRMMDRHPSFHDYQVTAMVVTSLLVWPSGGDVFEAPPVSLGK